MKYDVVVLGGGPAGVAAGIQSARSGAYTLLVEANGYLGGMTTHGNLPAFCPFSDGEKAVIRGIGMEILDELSDNCWYSDFYPRERDGRRNLDWFPIDSELLKSIYDRKVIESGCEVLLHTQMIGCEMDGSRIRSVTLFHAGGRLNVEADVFIDCTGDAMLAAAAGCDIEIGDEDGEVQSATLCFKIANFDSERFAVYARENHEGGNLFGACNRAIAADDFIPGEFKVSGVTLPAPGVAVFNFGHVFEVDPLDPANMTHAEMQARAQLPKLMAFLRKYVPGCEEAVLVSSGPSIGIRESRRVIGQYVLTADDYYARSDFEDAIAYYCYPIDIHGAKAKSDKNDSYHQVFYQQRYSKGESYAVPYRCLLPNKVDNLMTAGRIISCDRQMLGSVRVVPCCFATGQAAGMAAAMASRLHSGPNAIDIQSLRQELRNAGAWLR